MKNLPNRLWNLLSIKSLITLGIIGVFLYLCVVGREIPKNLDTYAGLVIAWYFSTQANELFQKKAQQEQEEKTKNDLGGEY